VGCGVFVDSMFAHTHLNIQVDLWKTHCTCKRSMFDPFRFIWDPFGYLGVSWGPWGVLLDPLGSLGIPWGSFGDPSGISWEALGNPGGSWGMLGDSWGVPWVSLGINLKQIRFLGYLETGHMDSRWQLD
jgi:hypothetical protein